MSKIEEYIPSTSHQSIQPQDSFEKIHDEKLNETMMEKGRIRTDEDYSTSYDGGDEKVLGGWKPTEEQVKVQKSMRRKLDFTLLPILTIVYLFNALDKGNLGNAKTGTLVQDLHLKGDQYYLITMIFYVPFCLCGIPLTLVIKKYSAARVIPILMFGFGSLSMIQAGVINFGGLFGLRMLLGIAESPMLPGVVFYLSTFYTRGELAGRVGIFYAAAAISGAFSGLIAYGVFQIKNPPISAWRILFLIEGAATCAFAIFAFFVLPRNSQSAWMLNEKEKEVAKERIEKDASVSVSEKLDIRDALRPFRDWRYAVWAAISFTLGVPLVSVNTFLPQIVARLGYNTVKTNLYTVAPNVCGAVFLLILTQFSDRFRERGLHSCFALVVGLAGWISLAVIPPSNVHATYGAIFLAAMGASAPSVLTATWYTNNTSSESRRALLAAVMIALANAAGLVSTNIFQAKWEPDYTPSLAISGAFCGLCLIITFTWTMYLRFDNSRRNRIQGVQLKAQDVATSELAKGWKSPHFRWTT